MQYDKPLIEFDAKGNLTKYVVGICDTCGKEIDNSKGPFVADKNKIYHVNCYKI